MDYSRIINQVSPRHPLSLLQLGDLAQACQVHSGSRVLDLGCYDGMLLNHWARQYDLRGTGVDDDEAAIQKAMTLANSMDVWSQLQYVTADVYDYPQPFHQYNVVTWLNSGAGHELPRWLAVMRSALRDAGGLLVVGETFWRTLPPRRVLASRGLEREMLPTQDELIRVFHRHHLDVMDAIFVDENGWDRYYANQWRAVKAWLADNTHDEAASEVRAAWRRSQVSYFSFERSYVGWGAFILAGDAG
jgi:cyclopropane fatty-acyl-phospholipid synthase-like methyltransferase